MSAAQRPEALEREGRVLRSIRRRLRRLQRDLRARLEADDAAPTLVVHAAAVAEAARALETLDMGPQTPAGGMWLVRLLLRRELLGLEARIDLSRFDRGLSARLDAIHAALNLLP